MVSIILLDARGTIHEVFLLPMCSPKEAASILECARCAGFRALRREVHAVASASDLCVDLVDMTDHVTSEHDVYRPCLPAVEAHAGSPTATARLEATTTTLAPMGELQLDWDEP